MVSSDEAHDGDDEQNSQFDEDSGPSKPWNAKTTKLRACDRCRKKKVRCDAAERRGARCTNCVTGKTECTFVEQAQRRGPSKGYIRDLERRCEALERLLTKVAPHIDVAKEVGPSFSQQTWADAKATGRIPMYQPHLLNHATSAIPPVPLSSPTPTLVPSPTLNPTFYPSNNFGLPIDPTQYEEAMGLSSTDMTDSEDGESRPSEYRLRPLDKQLAFLNLNGFQRRFHGKSSTVYLVQEALNQIDGPKGMIPLECMRSGFWRPEPWTWTNTSLPNPATLSYPPDDLADELVEMAFKHIIPMYPFIYRPSFEVQRKASLHKRSIAFARVYLMVCATGARYCSDPRVCYSDRDGVPQRASAGWVYFSQVLNMRWPILAPVSQSDLQVIGLMSIYLKARSVSHASWLVAGVGLRAALDIGLHRERAYAAETPFNAQMWKRIFWALVTLDRDSSACLGRPIMIYDEDIDAKLPLEVDDEFYDGVTEIWLQPQDKPASITAFVQYVKLMRILSHAIELLYSINKRKVHDGHIGEEWESHAVADLDSASNAWLNGLPDHLRWAPNIPDDQTFHQSAFLRIMYLWVQIIIHRPSLLTSTQGRKSSPLACPSLTMCTDAPRATSHVLEEYTRREFYGGSIISVVFGTATTLLISLSIHRKNGRSVDMMKYKEDLQRFGNFFLQAEKSFYLAGKFYDILSTISSLHGINLRQPTARDVTLGDAFSEQRLDYTIRSGAPSDVAATTFASTSSSRPGHIRTKETRHSSSTPSPMSLSASLPPQPGPRQTDWPTNSNTGPGVSVHPTGSGHPGSYSQQALEGVPSSGLFADSFPYGNASASFSETQLEAFVGSQTGDDWAWFHQMVLGDVGVNPLGHNIPGGRGE